MVDRGWGSQREGSLLIPPHHSKQQQSLSDVILRADGMGLRFSGSHHQVPLETSSVDGSIRSRTVKLHTNLHHKKQKHEREPLLRVLPVVFEL